MRRDKLQNTDHMEKDIKDDYWSGY